MTQALAIPEQTVLPAEIRARLSEVEKKTVTEVVRAFLETTGTSTARATHYNTKEEQIEAAQKVHDALFQLDRGVYGAFLTLPGVTDFSRQLGVQRLLSNTRDESLPTVLTREQESRLLKYLLSHMSTPRMLKLFGMIKDRRINNNRTRKLILRTLFNSDRLELWVVKYRRKVRVALEHAFGNRTGIIRSILTKNDWTPKEKGILHSNIGKFTSVDCHRDSRIFECVAFALGLESGLLHVGPTLSLLKAYIAAKTDLGAGKDLPFETLDGIRSKFHPDKTSAEVLEMTKENLTDAQKMNLQAKAEKDNVKVEFDPTKQDAVKLYIYGFERGFTDEIESALLKKATQAARDFPLSFGRVGVVVDASQSMRGHKTQALRPFAIGLAIRDLIRSASTECTTKYVGGFANNADGPEARLVPRTPGQGTYLAKAILELFKDGVEAVFVITDGYENAPSGRASEVIEHARKIGIETPVYQLTPVFAAESAGTRDIFRSEVPSLPVSNPAALGVTLVRGVLETEPIDGIEGLLRMALPKFAGQLTEGGEG